MTTSKSDRKDELQNTLATILEGLGHRALNDYIFGSNDRATIDVRSTTWDELVRRGWVRQLGSGAPLYALTGAGWIEALRVTAALEAQRPQAIQLVKVFKEKVKGRAEDGLATIHDFGPVGISPAFVFNAVESGLLDELFPGRGYRTGWSERDPRNSGAPLFTIPRDFGLSDLD